MKVLGQMPFAEDVRHYKFASMTNYFNVKGGRIESHPYLPTTEHIKAMDSFVDGMDLMDADVDDVGYAPSLLSPSLRTDVDRG